MASASARLKSWGPSLRHPSPSLRLRIQTDVTVRTDRVTVNPDYVTNSVSNRQHNLDSELVKAYTADFCGTRRSKKRAGSCRVVYLHIGRLQKRTDGLICKLNSYAQPAEMKNETPCAWPYAEGHDGDGVFEGIFLVRVDGASYPGIRRDPSLVLQFLAVLEPQDFPRPQILRAPVCHRASALAAELVPFVILATTANYSLMMR